MLRRRLTAPASQSPVSMGHQLCHSAQPRNCRTTPSRKAPARPASLRRGGESSARRCPRAAGGRQRAAGRRWRRQRRGDAAAASHSDVVDRHGRAAGRGKETRPTRLLAGTGARRTSELDVRDAQARSVHLAGAQARQQETPALGHSGSSAKPFSHPAVRNLAVPSNRTASDNAQTAEKPGRVGLWCRCGRCGRCLDPGALA